MWELITCSNACWEALQTAIGNDAFQTITVPFPGLDIEESQAWALADQAARAIKETEGKLNNANKVELERVTFVCTSLLFADVLCTVSRFGLVWFDSFYVCVSTITAI